VSFGLDIVRDAEEQRQKADEFFSRKAEKAAKATHAFLSSDLLKAALPLVELPDQISSWKWVGPSLFADLKLVVGSNAAYRFLLLAIPLLTGERPRDVRVWLQQQRKQRAKIEPGQIAPKIPLPRQTESASYGR
jgi:hypothetical protein